MEKKGITTIGAKSFLLACVILILLIMHGCTKNSFVSCCIKSGIFEPDGTPKGNPKCFFLNGSFFGNCEILPDTKSAVLCSDEKGTSCASLTSQESCEKTANCIWNETSSPKCIGPQAKWVMGVCTDKTPQECVNEKCTAMICGYSSLKPLPPIASQDWDAQKAALNYESGKEQNLMPQSELILPTINLQGTACDFNIMNKKLYNKVASSRGKLWVNSFRFGVGNSFSDYEAANLFFPPTDRICGINPNARVDRFTVYLNMPETFCPKVQSYWECTGGQKFSGMIFADSSTCNKYCGGGLPPYQCVQKSGEKYVCNENKFAYNNKSKCIEKCSIISSASPCTNDTSIYPFLKSDETNVARYRMKYIADYMVDTPNPTCEKEKKTDDKKKCDGFEQCKHISGPFGNISTPIWAIDSDGKKCDDFGKTDTWADGPWYWTHESNPSNTYVGELRTYFDNRAYSALSFDYQYYAKKLNEQYQHIETIRPYECESSNDCMSGVCDTTFYSRSVCKTIDDGYVDCNCTLVTHDNKKYPSCLLFGSGAKGMWADTGRTLQGSTSHEAYGPIKDFNPLFIPDSSYQYGGQASSQFIFYVPTDLPKPKLFEKCQVQPIGPVKKCIDLDCFEVISGYSPTGASYSSFIYFNAIWDPESNGKCYDCRGQLRPSPKDYWVYNINLQSGTLGSCKLNKKYDPPTPLHPPFLEIKQTGWCMPCTYATLAVQEVKWGQPNPGGVGVPRARSCYQYHGEFNYVPGEYPYGGAVGDPVSWNSWNGTLRWSMASTHTVRKTSNPSEFIYDYDGNLELGEKGQLKEVLICKDEWHPNNEWWLPEEIPTPSAPYLKEKLTSLLQSNVMPIIDVVNEKTKNGTRCWNDYWNNNPKCDSDCPRPPFFNYAPLSICDEYGGEGTILYAIGSTAMLDEDQNPQGDYGKVFLPCLPENLKNYMFGSQQQQAGTYTFQKNRFGGKNAIITRTHFLKSVCKVPPLVGIEIPAFASTEKTMANLHYFFFNEGRPDYVQRVARGMPDPYPGEVDVLLQSWYPYCNYGGHAPGDNEKIEIKRRMNFSRQLLYNFSKPSLIWKFAFPQGSSCNQTVFFDILFNNTGELVDSGIIGFIYSDWMARDGLGFGPPLRVYQDTQTYTKPPPNRTHNFPNLVLKTGLTNLTTVARGNNSINTAPLDSPYKGKNETFCALQRFSKRVIGYSAFTYGQILYAENKTCMCVPCSDFDYISGACDRNAPNLPDIDQLFCNDGALCTMPEGATNYNQYKCKERCVDSSKCRLCKDPANLPYSSFCWMSEPSGMHTETGYLSLNQISDTYWEFLAGLPAKEKCCLINNKEGGGKYTYVAFEGTKTQSEVLQFPTRGIEGIDCGRSPDTSVLSYCNIRVPMSQMKITCERVVSAGAPPSSGPVMIE